ncbi:MAG: hypothetical protein ABH837_01945 [bacterium]
MKILDSQPVLVRFWLWYYGEALSTIWQIITNYCLSIIDTFSLPTLATTLFDPWKRDVVGGKNLPLNMRIQMFFWNQFSRLIGFFVRAIVIIIAGAILSLEFITGIIFIALWIVFPVGIIYLIWYSFYLLTI